MHVVVVYERKMFIDLRLHDSIVVSIPACHAGDRGSIPRRGAFFTTVLVYNIFC